MPAASPTRNKRGRPARAAAAAEHSDEEHSDNNPGGGGGRSRRDIKKKPVYVAVIVLTIIILFSTTSALYVLHALGAPKTFLFIGCSPEGTPFTRFGNAFKKVIEGSLVGDPYFECMAHHNESVDYWVAWVVAVGFQIVVGLLLVNMLIAKMAKVCPHPLHRKPCLPP